jgi:hypothetical protein
MFSVNASLETNGIDPAASFSTAGFSLKEYRHSFYDGTIMDLSSWDVKRRSSAMEDYWFNAILIRERGLRVVKHKIIRGGKVDGYDETTNTVYQFHGCYWHGCHKCFPNREDVRLALSRRDNAILEARYNLEITWEQELRAQ